MTQAPTDPAALLRDLYPPLPGSIRRSRFMTSQTVWSLPHAQALIDGSFTEPRLSLTRGDPWLPDGVPVLNVDGLPVVISGSHFVLPLTGVSAHTQDALPAALLRDGAPVPFQLRRFEDLSAALDHGDPYQPRTDASFSPLTPTPAPNPDPAAPAASTPLPLVLAALLTAATQALTHLAPLLGPVTTRTG